MVKVEVALCDLIKYIGNRHRPLKEGEAVFKAGHVILCQVNMGDNKIFALVLQTSALVPPPHEVNISLKDNWDCKCSCKAGQSGFCKHVVATLIYINRHEEMEELSCTDMAQAWGKEKNAVKTMYGAEKLRTFCHPERKRNIEITCSETTSKKNFEILLNCKTTSSIYKFKKRFNSSQIRNPTPSTSTKVIRGNQEEEYLLEIILQQEDHSQFLADGIIDISDLNLRRCCMDAIQKLIAHDRKQAALCAQGSSEWYLFRQFRVTGSRCYSLYTYKKEDWETMAKKYFWPKSFSNIYTKYGKEQEIFAVEAYKQANPDCLLYRPGLIISKRFPWFGYSPDGVVFQDRIPIKLLEIKCPYSGKENGHDSFPETCQFLENKEGVIALKRKHAYYGQVQLGMAILNLRIAELIVYSSYSKNFLNVQIPFDEEFAKSLITEVSENFLKNMLHVWCDHV